MVLTLNPERRETGEPWKSRFEAFDELKERWRSLARAISRNFGKAHYVSTVEVHRSGWPHLNVILANPELAQLVRENNGKAKEWLKDRAVACGFGYMCSIEVAKSREQVAGYCVKVAGEIEEAAKPDSSGKLVGEVVKLSQLPEEAPKGFRRLRSSTGFLPKPFKVDGVTGKLVQAPMPTADEIVQANKLQRSIDEIVEMSPPRPAQPSLEPVVVVPLAEPVVPATVLAECERCSDVAVEKEVAAEMPNCPKCGVKCSVIRGHRPRDEHRVDKRALISPLYQRKKKPKPVENIDERKTRIEQARRDWELVEVLERRRIFIPSRIDRRAESNESESSTVEGVGPPERNVHGRNS